MIGSIVIAAAIGLTAPVKAEPSGSPARWVRASDLPQSKDQATVTTFDLMIDQTGRPIQCTVVTASGSDHLDSAVCAAVMKRARFKPAKDAADAPIPSVYRDRVLWLPNAYGPNQWIKTPDIVVSTPIITNRLTDVADVVVLVDSTGAVDECFIADSVGSAALDELACSVVRSSQISPPITDAQGAVVRGVRSFYVGFRPNAVSGVEIK